MGGLVWTLSPPRGSWARPPPSDSREVWHQEHQAVHFMLRNIEEARTGTSGVLRNIVTRQHPCKKGDRQEIFSPKWILAKVLHFLSSHVSKSHQRLDSRLSEEEV